MKLICYFCKSKLKQKGAILVSPPKISPIETGYDEVGKMHICIICYKELVQYGLKNIIWKDSIK